MRNTNSVNNVQVNRDVADFCMGTIWLKQMVKRVSWFAKIDYPLFGFFENHDIRVTPKVVADNIGYGRNYTGKRLRALRDAGLLMQHDNGSYELSDLGREFLADNLSREELEALDPDKDDTDD